MRALAALAERLPRRVKGMALGLVAAASFTLLHASVSYASRELHVFEITFFRYFIALFFMLPRLVRSRGAVTALSFISPVFASVAAIVLLRERSSLARWLAVAGGVIGMLLIVRPGVIPLSAGPVLAICGAQAWAVSIIVIKLMSSTESSTTQVTYMSIVVTPLTLLLAVWVWKWPSLQMIPVLLFMAGIATVGQFAYTKSFQYAEATALMPLDFTRLMWASLIGYVVFGEVPDIWSRIGGTIIFLSAAYITLRESSGRAAQPPATPPGADTAAAPAAPPGARRCR